MREERVLFWAVALSALVHAVLFLGLRFHAPGAGGVPVAAVAPRIEPVGMRVIDIVPVPDDEIPEAQAPEQLREQTAPRIVRVPPAGAVDASPPADRADPAATVTERISPRMGDARLFTESGRPMPAPTDPEALARERFLARIDSYNAVEAEAAEAARKATDWTVKDGSGNRWGVSPGKIHLGGLTLPLPVGFAPPPGRREELAERTRRFGDIEDQRARETGRATFDERVKAIRERNDAKRDSTRKSGSGG